MKRTRLEMRQRGKEQKETQVKIIYQYNRSRKVELPTGIYLSPGQWNKSRREVKRTHPDSQVLNEALNVMKLKADTIIRDMIVRGDDPMPHVIKERFLKKSNLQSNESEFFDVFENWLERKKDQVTVDSYKDYKSLRKHLRGFESFRKVELKFRQIDFAFYEDFIVYLEHHMTKPNGEIGLSRGSVGKQIKNLKVFLKNCMQRNLTDFIPLDDWKVFRETGDHVYLTEADLNLIEAKGFDQGSELELVKDMLLVGCETGLRYSDFSAISPYAIQGKVIQTKTRKTLRDVIIPISRRLKEILDKYDNHLPQDYPQYRFNRLVKDVVKLSGIDEHVQILKHKGNTKVSSWVPKWQLVASHTCRRSFCTNAFKKGMSPIVIRAISGHASEQNLLRYIKVSPYEAAEIEILGKLNH